MRGAQWSANPVSSALTRDGWGDIGALPMRKRVAVSPKTPRSPSRFRERELARALRAARSAGGERVDIDPASGRISVILSKPGEAASDKNEWDEDGEASTEIR
jgi:hypothetical protein